MTIHLPPDLESKIQAEVLKGHYSSLDEAVAEALYLLLQRGQRDEGDESATLTADQLADQEAQQRLFAAGLLSEIRPPQRVSTGTEQFTPIIIEGESLSETIIRERR